MALLGVSNPTNYSLSTQLFELGEPRAGRAGGSGAAEMRGDGVCLASRRARHHQRRVVDRRTSRSASVAARCVADICIGGLFPFAIDDQNASAAAFVDEIARVNADAASGWPRSTFGAALARRRSGVGLTRLL